MTSAGELPLSAEEEAAVRWHWRTKPTWNGPLPVVAAQMRVAALLHGVGHAPTPPAARDGK
jgi:HD superfamily phosphohydrolase